MIKQKWRLESLMKADTGLRYSFAEETQKQKKTQTTTKKPNQTNPNQTNRRKYQKPVCLTNNTLNV